MPGAGEVPRTKQTPQQQDWTIMMKPQDILDVLSIRDILAANYGLTETITALINWKNEGAPSVQSLDPWPEADAAEAPVAPPKSTKTAPPKPTKAVAPPVKSKAKAAPPPADDDDEPFESSPDPSESDDSDQF